MSYPKRFPKIRFRTLGIVLGVVLVTLILISCVFVYLLPDTMPGAAVLRSSLPYPVVALDYRKMITHRELSENIVAVRRFYENQDFSQIGLRVDFSTDEGKKRLKMQEKEVLNKMLEDRAIEVLARERDISITEEMARSGLLRALEEYESEGPVKENLARLYGWTLDDFQEKIVLPSLYEEKLSERFEVEVDTKTKAKERIALAEKTLLEKKNFGDVAREFSEGETKERGGELGWFALAQLTPELQEAIKIQRIGEPGRIVESSLGFHIVLLHEKKQEEGAELYRISQIFVPKIMFADWLTEKMREMSVVLWSPEYRYNQETAEAEFRREDMRIFEQKMLEERVGDTPLF